MLLHTALFTLACAASLCFEGAESIEERALKMVSYNVYNGFDYGKDKPRQEAMVRWLRAQNADVIGLQELNGYTEEKLRRIARQWGHNHAVLLKEDGYPIGITSRQPIELRSKIVGGMWHGMLHVRTYNIDFLVVHLSPQDWAYRLREASLITEYIKVSLLANDIGRFVVMGDFNAHSPFDAQTDRQQSDLLRYYELRDAELRKEGGDKKYQTLKNGRIDYSVMSKFLSVPLTDLAAHFAPASNRFTSSTQLSVNDATGIDRSRRKRRIDYILVSSELERGCKLAQLVDPQAVERLSDHYPVVASCGVF